MEDKGSRAGMGMKGSFLCRQDGSSEVITSLTSLIPLSRTAVE